ncbi:MAG: glycosyltransferase family 9 protein, partial [Acetobacteraceae bacterium]
VREVLWMDRNPERLRGLHDGLGGLVRLIRLLRGHRFARTIVMHHSRTLAFAALAAGVPERYGYGFGLQRRFLNRPPALPPAALRLHPHEQATAWLAAAGVALADAEPRLPVAAEAQRAVRERLGPAALPTVVMGIGSSEPYKQWGAARFVALADALADAGWRRLVLAGGPAEAGLAAAIAEGTRAGGLVVPAIGWELSVLAALCAEAGFYVGNDTGVMNLAAAVGARSYGLFGATAPILHSRRIVGILPADRRASVAGGMAGITVEAVLAAIRDDRGGLSPESGGG